MLMIFVQLPNCTLNSKIADSVTYYCFHRGMKTVYIQRSTEDPDEDMEQVKNDVDLFIDGRDGAGGLVELAELSGA